MDFRTPQAVIDALVDRAKHGIFGYSENERDYFDVVHDWFDKRFNWKTHRNGLSKRPVVVLRSVLPFEV
jgi:cystathionine beta-lyase